MATGVPNGNHGLFLRYGIAAVTLTGEKTVRTNARSSSLLQLGRVMEGVCRSLNNLMETFHQSFFFYLLPATDRYISIGVYMPAFGALGSSIVLCALALWVSTGAHETPLALGEGKQGDSQVSAHGSHWLVATLPLLLSYHLLGVLVIRAIPLIVGLAPHLEGMELDADEALVLGLVAFCLASLCVPSCFNRSLLVPPCWQLLKCVLCLELSVLLFSGAVYNIALATIVTAVYAPVLLLLKPRENRLMGWAQRALLLLIHPLSLAALAVCLDTKLNFPSSGFLDLVDKTGGAFKRAVMFSVLDSAIYANWLFHAACLALLPNWCVMWHVSFLQTYTEKPSKVKTN